MSIFSDELVAIAEELITEYGELAVFTRVTQGVYDPTSGESFSETSLSYSGYVVPTKFNYLEIDGTVIQKEDLKILAHNMDEEPQVDDIIEINSVEYRIINVRHTRVNGNNVLHELQVRA